MSLIGFDVESANEYEEGMPLEELGLSCAALWENGEALVYPAIDPFGFYADEFTPPIAQDLADYLIATTEQGNRIVTWNGASFDGPLVAAMCKSEVYEEKLKWVFLNHIDIGVCMAMDKGFMVGLNTAAIGLGIAGKTEGMTGSLAPILWKGVDRDLTEEEQRAIDVLGVTPQSDEARDLCLEYVSNDAKITMDVYHELERSGKLAWTTKKGTRSKSPWYPDFDDGGALPLVRYYLDIAQPELDWEDNPFKKQRLLRWITSTT
jgi:hypothetical protein